MRVKAFILSIIMILSMIPLQMMGVYAAGDETILEDDFSSDAGNWTDMVNPNPSLARYSISNGIMNVTTDKVTGGNRVYIKNAVEFGSGDYELSLRLRLNSWTEYTYVLFRAESLTQCYGLWYNSYGYEKAVSIVKNGTTTIMPGAAKNAVAAGFKTVGWNDIKVKLQGNRIQVYINNMDVPAFDITDTENPNMTGGIAFGTHTGQSIATGLSVDDVKVTVPGNMDTSMFGDYDAPGDVVGTNYEDAAKLLMDLYIMDSYEKEDNFKEQASVTRGEFAKIMISALDMEPGPAPEDDVTVDVSSDHEYAAYIATALNYGILSLTYDGKFNPEQPLKYEEAVKCIVHTMGYNDLASYYGGYPDGYLEVAKDLKLLNGIDSKKGYAITKGHLATLIYNALHCEILHVVGVTEDDLIYNKGPETWLNYYFDIYQETGVVEATSNMAVRNASLTDDGTVCIDNYIFRVGNSDIEEYFGAEVDYYYYETDSNRYIVSAVLTDDSILEISSRDLIDYDNHTYRYYRGDKTREAKVAAMADFFYNGRSMGQNEFYEPEYGNVKLVDTDGNGTYDVVQVTSYSTTIYHTYSTAENVIIDKYDAKFDIPLETADGKANYKIRNQKGQALEPDKIPTGSLLSVAVSADGKLVNIEVSTDKVMGVVQTVFDDTVKINDAEYRKSSIIRNAEILSAGSTVELMLDYMGEIAYVSSTGSSGSFSYIIDKVEIYDGIETTVQVKFYNSVSGSIEIAPCREKIKIDGTTYSDTGIISSKILLESPAIIKLASGSITEIDYPYTAAPEPEEDDSSLKYLGGDKETIAFFYDMMFGNKIAVTSNTVMIDVPRDGVTADNEKLFKVSSPSRLSLMKYYRVVGYSTGNSLTAQYLLRYVSSAEVSLGTPTMLDTWGQALDADRNVCTFIEGYNRNGRVRYDLSYDATKSHADMINNFKRGMILNVKTDSNSVAHSLEVLYDKATDEVVSEWYDGGGAHDREFYKARLGDTDDTCMVYLRENTDGTTDERITKHTSAKVYIMSESEDEIITSSIKELKSVDRDGYDNSDVMLIHQAQILPRAIFVYRP